MVLQSIYQSPKNCCFWNILYDRNFFFLCRSHVWAFWSHLAVWWLHIMVMFWISLKDRQQREGVLGRANLAAVTFLVLNSTSRWNTLLLSPWILMINSLLLAVMKYWKLLEIRSRQRVSLSQLLVTWMPYTNGWYILYNIPLTLSICSGFFKILVKQWKSYFWAVHCFPVLW